MHLKTKFRQVIYAPNINSGGGLELLLDLIRSCPKETVINCILDKRIKPLIEKVPNINVIYWVDVSLLSKITSEIALYQCTNHSSKIICLHNIPPIFAKTKSIIVFVQNRLILEKKISSFVRISTYINVKIEKVLNYLFASKVQIYICQTESMKSLLQDFIKSPNIKIKVLPFRYFPLHHSTAILEKKWDFIYIAGGEPHKNHFNLLESWKLLANEGIFPSLALTIPTENSFLIECLNNICINKNINIFNYGSIDNDVVKALYKSSSCLIYPSIVESFGLPLFEARTYGIPIIASELDYVRDICLPIQTFDPKSPKSIARAVKRFYKHEEHLQTVNSPEVFWDYINSV